MADGRSSLSAGFHELMDMIKEECNAGTPPALCFHIDTTEIRYMFLETCMHTLARFATAVAERTPPSGCAARLSLALQYLYVTPAIAQAICGLYSTGLLCVCKYVILDPLKLLLNKEELVEVLHLVVSEDHEVTIEPNLLGDSERTAPDIRRVFDVARACPIVGRVQVGELLFSCSRVQELLDVFVAELAGYLVSRNHQGRVDCDASDYKGHRKWEGEALFMDRILAWKKTQPDVHISVATLTANFEFASGLLALIDDLSELNLRPHDYPYGGPNHAMPCISKFGRLRTLRLSAAHIQSMDLLGAAIFPRLECLDLSHVTIEEPRSCGRFIDELSVEPRASRLYHLFLDHSLDRDTATRLMDVLKTNRVLRYLAVAVQDCGMYLALKGYSDGAVFARLSSEDVRCRAVFISVVERGSRRYMRSLDDFLIKQILLFGAPHTKRILEITLSQRPYRSI